MRGIPPAVRSSRYFVEDMIARMDQCGIDLSVVIAHSYFGWSMERFREEHDAVMGDIEKFPDRLVGYCWVNPHFGEDALEELERCVSDLGYMGMKLHPKLEQFSIDSRIVDPFVEKAAELDIPVMVHTEMGTRGDEPWRLVNLCKRFPEVTFFMGHMGLDIGYVGDLTIPRIAMDVNNLILETSCTSTDPWATFAGPALLLGPERVVYGSDAGPSHHNAVNLFKLDLLDLDQRTKRLILGENMLRILKLNPKTLGTSASGIL
jgi:predicted TIM-barrel fold metal-dependent hydrolase